MDHLLSALSRFETFAAFLVCVVPGFISLRTYEALRGGEPRRINDALIDVVIYSVANDAVWIPVLIATSALHETLFRFAVMTGCIVLALVASPIAFAIAWHRLQRHLADKGAVSDPTMKPWDKMFKRIVRNDLDVGIVLTLRDGTKVGGRYVAPGFASHHPAKEQLHIGETWEIDQGDGTFIHRVLGSQGFIIDKEDAVTVEFVDWTQAKRTKSQDGCVNG